MIAGDDRFHKDRNHPWGVCLLLWQENRFVRSSAGTEKER